MGRCQVSHLVFLTVLSGCVTQSATLRLTPVCEEEIPSALDVKLSLELEGVPRFHLDDRVFGAPGMASLISDVSAHDLRGELPLDRTGELELVATREAVGEVTLEYRARSISAEDRGARFALRHDQTGIGGLGAFFLVLPEESRSQHTRIEWGPSACASTSAPMDHPGPLDGLRAVPYFAGDPRVTAEGHFRASWFGAPAFDPSEAGAWAARAFAVEKEFFGDKDESKPYDIYVRVLESMGSRANGVGQRDSFVSVIGPRTPFGPRLRTNLAHEMLHRWIGLRLRLAGPEGSNFWFTEGFTVHYAATLMLRAQLISAQEFLAEVNGVVIRHFANPSMNASNDEIRRRFFEDDSLSVVPYTRGALYAAELDASIRHASNGKRSLDDLIKSLGLKEHPASAFREAVERELGPKGAERFDAVILHGAQPNPADDAYGYRFTRRPRMIPLYELGFDDRAGVVKDLISGSAAQRAGLVEGDELLSVDAAPLVPTQEAVVVVKRDGKEIVVRYFPAREGANTLGWEWVERELADLRFPLSLRERALGEGGLLTDPPPHPDPLPKGEGVNGATPLHASRQPRTSRSWW